MSQSQSCVEQFAAPAIAQVHIDGAFAMLMRSVLGNCAGPGPAIYLWCDSSPQAGVDWLMSMFDFIDRADLVHCFEHYQHLFISSAQIKEAVGKEQTDMVFLGNVGMQRFCLLYTSPSPRDA